MGVQNVLGVNYPYPDVNDKPWGDEHIDWATAVSEATNTIEAQVDDIVDVQIPDLQAQINLSGQANTSSNEGAGEGLALAKVGVNLPFKTLIAGTQVSFVSAADTLTINATSSGDVTGPVASIDGNVAVYEGSTGKVIRLSGVNIDTSNNMTDVNNFETIGDVTISGTGTHTISTEFGNASYDAVTRSNGTSVGIRGVAISAESGSVTETTTTFQDIGVTATLTSTGRPIFVGLTCDSSDGQIECYLDSGSGNAGSGKIRIKRDGSVIYLTTPSVVTEATSTLGFTIPPSSIWTITTVAAGTYDFTCEIAGAAANLAINVNAIKIVAFEL